MSRGAKSSTLTIRETTQGVSVDGIESILQHIKKNITVELKNNVKNYNNMINIIKECWSGEDCNKWCEKFITMADETAKSLDFYYSQIEAEFKKVIQEWEEFQSSNVRPG